MARVFKAKYFPFDNVLNSKKGCNPSYAWRSIHNSLEVIKRGTRRRVGNGRRIHIWDDRWLPTPSTHKVISPQDGYGDFPWVSSLIDVDTRWWKIDVINATFLPHEANTILNIPLNYNLPEDCLIWIGNKRGEFTVKSAYHIASSSVDTLEEGESTSSSSWTLLWKRIWQQKVPPKIKIFAWRACVNGLPSMKNLNHRGVHCSSFCPLYDKAIETTTHALLHCDHAKMTWAFWNNCPVDLSSSFSDLVDIALDFIVKGSPNDLDFFFCRCLVNLVELQSSNPWGLGFPSNPCLGNGRWSLGRIQGCLLLSVSFSVHPSVQVESSTFRLYQNQHWCSSLWRWEEIVHRCSHSR